MIVRDCNIPLGAQHAALLEPLRFELMTKNEMIEDVRFDFGYVHRGVEKACTEKFKYKQVGYVVARVCGLCAITHSTAYTLAVESLMGVEVTRRIKWLRMLMLELDRIHSHLLCLAHTAESAGFEALFMQTMADRELVMEVQEALTGNRVQFDYVNIGGVNRDLDGACVDVLKKNLATLRTKMGALKDLFLTNPTLSLCYRGVGSLIPETGKDLDTTGVLARAAGIPTDHRTDPSHFEYEAIGFEMKMAETGDIHARNLIRLKEIENSMEMCENIADNLPEGDIEVKVKGRPKGEAVAHLEAPRGELFYYIRGDGSQTLERLRMRTPTYANIPAMIEIFKGEAYNSVPAILASFDPCMSCTAK